MGQSSDDTARQTSRRDILRYGALAAAGSAMLGPLGRAMAGEPAPVTGATLPAGGKAKQVVLMYMNGGASHLDTFDPKPGASTGGPTKAVPTSVPGIHIASTLPELGKRMDDICLVRGMSSKEGNHERARYLMHTGYPPTPTVQHAGLGSMLAHEKGSPDADLPSYIAVNGPGARPGFLGPGYAPFQVRTQDPARSARRRGGGGGVVQNLALAKEMTKRRRDRRLDLLARLNEGFAEEHGRQMTDAQEAMFERARRLMDSPKNTAFDLSAEKPGTVERYGKSGFGYGCLMARRLLDQGVTCVEVMSNGWDTHDDNFNRVGALNNDVDRGASALLDDLKASGRLDETLVIWLGDFGRTPRITSSQGRGHYPRAWSLWLAGGGVEGGRVVGATDAEGKEVVDGMVSVPDLFASFAHATGMDPTKTFHSNGRPISIVYEEGHVVGDMFNA